LSNGNQKPLLVPGYSLLVIDWALFKAGKEEAQRKGIFSPQERNEQPATSNEQRFLIPI
jgi:hypothetical protein